jgi:predicted Rossmann fold nucleotide-binding protein DprA/Smf involved in DNA uptake
MKAAMKVRWIRQGDAQYPKPLVKRMGGAAPAAIAAAGDMNILRRPRVGLICSIQCPGSIVIKTFDAIRTLRDAGVTMIGGFHSPMERECLEILLRGPQPVVFSPARSLSRLRIGQEARKALAEGRLLLLSVFGEDIQRTTSTQALERNNLVAALADVVFVPYAAPAGKTWATVCKALERRQKVFAPEDEANNDLFTCGVTACQSNNLDDLISQIGKS